MFGLIPYNKRGNGLTRSSDFFTLRNVFDDFFNDSFMPAYFNSVNQMKADIKETEKEYIIEAEIPGVKKEDIKLELKDDTLTIAVEHNEEVKEERENYIRKERKFGSFARSFYVENVNHEGVAAKYDNGILSVTIPKAEAGKEKNRRINIQ